MFNKLLRPWTLQKRETSSARSSKKSYIALAAMLLAGFGVQAQQTINGTAITPDHAAIQANKIQAPGTQTMPTSPMSPDPMISLLPPGMNSNSTYWNNMRRMRAAQSSAKSGGSSSGPINYTERERGEGHNDTQANAERIRNLGSGRRDRNEATISGSLPGFTIRPLTQTEDDGALGLANETGITAGPDGVTYSGVIGDGPMAGTVSDYDMYKVSLPAGTTFDISVVTPEPFGDLDPFVTFYLEDGTIIFQQDDGGNGFDTFVTLTVGANDLTFIMAVGGFGAFEPADPFNSTGGSVTGAIGSEGTYDFTIRAFPTGPSAVDFYSFHLDKGDVLGAAVRVEGSPVLQIFNQTEAFEKGVSGFGSFAVAESPLPINGNGAIDYVVEESGTYAIALSGGFGAYEMDLGVFRTEFEREKRRVQVIWLDYNGGPVSKEPWFGFPLVTDHTPFRDFLPAMGLPNSNSDIRRITNKMTRETRDNLYTELDDAHENRNLGVVVLGNDGTGNPSFFEPLIAAGSFSLLGLTFEVSVVEVSGTTSEAFINTIGIASTIDPGNYAVNDAALVLLDVLTAPATGGNANNTFSVNDVVLAPGVTKEDMATTVIANVISHEAGHYLGNFHTDGIFTTVQSLMDQGPGGFNNLAGIGPSGVYGAADQTDVAFVDDLYAITEGFQGDENTTVNTAYALSYFPFGGYHAHDPGMPAEIAQQLSPQTFTSQTLLNQSIPNSLVVGSSATINFQVAENSEAKIGLYDLAGNQVGTLFEGQVKGGESNTVTLNSGDFNLKPGVYIYKLDTANGSKHRKIVVK